MFLFALLAKKTLQLAGFYVGLASGYSITS